MQSILFTSNRKKLTFLTLVLVILNLTAVFYSDVNTMRIIRLFSISIFLAFYFLSDSQKNGLSFLILGTLLVRDFALLFYETEIGHETYVILGIVTYILICLSRSNSIKTILKDPSAFIFTLILITLNTYALYIIIGLVEQSFRGTFEPNLFYVYGALMILMGTTAFTYNQVYNSNRSLFYVFFVLCFLLSDVTSLFAYYFDYSQLFYIDKAAFIVGLGFFAFTITEKDMQSEENEQYALLS